MGLKHISANLARFPSLPPAGYLTTLLMMHACDNVRVYGTDFVPGTDAYHYYSDPSEQSGRREYPEDRHWFALEHALYEWWSDLGLLELRR